MLFWHGILQETTIEELKQQFIKKQDAKGFIVDGFPREISQVFTFEEQVRYSAFWWSTLYSIWSMNGTHTVFLQIGSPDLVILLACSNQQLRQRLEKRASQQGRPDDNTHAIEKRLDTFKHNITLIAKYYQERGLIVRVRCCSLLICILIVEFSWFSQHGLFCRWLQMLLCLKTV